jgi:hypothetical protein
MAAIGRIIRDKGHPTILCFQAGLLLLLCFAQLLRTVAFSP